MKKLVLCAVLLAGCRSPEEQAATTKAQNEAARAWCDRMGIRITGAECRAYDVDCDVAPEGAAPFRLRCDLNMNGTWTCRLPID